MKIDLFSSTGTKSGTLDLPAEIFGAPINYGLMHQALVRQQSGARQSAAHVKTRGEVVGSTRKLFAQKGTGQARRGPVRSPTLRGGGKAFGPRNDKNYIKEMPRSMRHAALRSVLSMQAAKGTILGLTDYPETVSTKALAQLLAKLPVEQRSILVLSSNKHNALVLSSRNIPYVTVTNTTTLNPESLLHARSIVLLEDALPALKKLLGNGKKTFTAEVKEVEKKEKPKAAKKAPAKKKTSTPKK